LAKSGCPETHSQKLRVVPGKFGRIGYDVLPDRLNNDLTYHILSS
jgi:hypothetical protein